MSSATPPSSSSNRSCSRLDADSYRVLGATEATQAYSDNMAPRALHRSHPQGSRSTFACKVTARGTSSRPPNDARPTTGPGAPRQRVRRRLRSAVPPPRNATGLLLRTNTHGIEVRCAEAAPLSRGQPATEGPHPQSAGPSCWEGVPSKAMAARSRRPALGPLASGALCRDIAARCVRRFRALVFVALGGVLAWQVLSRSLAAYLATVAPEAALRLRPNEPAALLNLATKKLALEAGSTDAASQAPVPAPRRTASRRRRLGEVRQRLLSVPSSRRRSKQHARADPRSRQEATAKRPVRPTLWPKPRWSTIHRGAALRILGQLAEAAGGEERAADLMQAAARRSIRESNAVYWLARAHFLAGL